VSIAFVQRQRGGVRFCVAAREQPEQSSTAACASAERPWRHVNSQSTTARRRALLQRRPWQPGHSSTTACASVGRHASQNKTARRGLPPKSALRGPRATLALPVVLGGWIFCRALCQPRPALRGATRAEDSGPLLGLSGRAARRVAHSRPPHEHGRNSTLAGSSAERIFF
jgi:hypothetical protein